MSRAGLVGMMLLMTGHLAFADDLGPFDDVGSKQGRQGGGAPPQAAPTQNPWGNSDTNAATKAQDCLAKEYLKQRPDVAKAMMDPLDHYNRYGKGEGMCHPTECTAAEYLRQRPDVVAANQGARVHFNNFGLNEGMCEPPIDQSAMAPSQKTADYDPATNTCTAAEYLRRRPDLSTNKWSLSIECHYTLYGQREGMCEPSINAPADFKMIQATCNASAPNPASQSSNKVVPTSSDFDAATNRCSGPEYLRRRPDVAAAGLNAACHYTLYGVKENMCIPSLDQSDWAGAQAACKAAQPKPPVQCSGTIDSGPYKGYSIANDPNNPYHRALQDGEWYYVNGTIFSCGQMRPR